jgi:hypothetical protein
MATSKKVSKTQDGRPTAVRFEATLGATPHAKAAQAAATLDLDRLPDAKGEVKLLLSADDARRLLEQGFEVHLKAAIPVAPLAKDRIMTDAQAKRWLEGQVKGLPRATKGRGAK